MKKKLTGLLLCLFMVTAFVLTGCDLFPRDVDAYLNKSVCTITYTDKTKEEITTEAFINAYNSYGSSLTQNGSTQEDAVNKTLDVLISRYVLLNHAKKTVSIDDDMEDVYDEVYTSLESSISSYVTAVKTEWKITTENAKSEDNSNVVKYTPYEPKAEVVYENEEYRIKLISQDKKSSTHFSSLDQVINAFNNYANPTGTDNNSKVMKEAYRRLMYVLKKNEEGRNLSTDNASILKRYAEKLLKNSEDNKYITKLEDFYKSDKNYSTISVRQVLDKYTSLVLESKYKYESDASAYDKAMLESFKDVYYVPDDNYFFVSNLLIKFTDEQKTEYANIDKDAYLSDKVKKQRKSELINDCVAKVRDNDGKIIDGEKVYVNDLLKDLQMELNNATTNDKKAQIFRDYLYKYGEDTGVQNAEYMYVIGTKTSKMVESFNTASRELNNKGEFGAISDLVASEYGVHIIFYGGKIENLFTVNSLENFKLDLSDIEKLTSAKLSVLNNKTVFDKVFETLSNDNYSIFENMNLNVLKKDLKIEKHKSVLDNL